MTQKSPLYTTEVDKIRRNMSIPPYRNDMIMEISMAMSRCHFEKLRLISVQIGKERSKAIEEKNQGKQLTDRKNSLLSCDLAWRMVISEYNKGVRQYAFIFALFNYLEDSLRTFVLEAYRRQFNGDGWHTTDARWPSWVRNKYSGTSEGVRLMGLNSTRVFLENLSFGELIAFIYDQHAWATLGCGRLFSNKLDPVNGLSMSNLTRCEAFERLKILQDRRNTIFHHKPLEKQYARPVENSRNTNSCDSNRGRNYTDGNAGNTIDRIGEILRYLGVNSQDLFASISSKEKTYLISDPASRTASSHSLG